MARPTIACPPTASTEMYKPENIVAGAPLNANNTLYDGKNGFLVGY